MAMKTIEVCGEKYLLGEKMHADLMGGVQQAVADMVAELPMSEAGREDSSVPVDLTFGGLKRLLEAAMVYGYLKGKGWKRC